MKQGLTIVSSVSQACTSELSQTLSSSWVISQVIHILETDAWLTAALWGSHKLSLDAWQAHN